MDPDARRRGMALVTALMLLAFLTMLGGVLLVNSTVDARIALNYRTRMQLVYLAEAGIAKALPRIEGDASALLRHASGVDGRLSGAAGLAALLAGDDRPLIPHAPEDRLAGSPLIDGEGRVAGRFHVFVRNDPSDGPSETLDTNEVLALVSVGTIGDAAHTIEVDVERTAPPRLPAALTLAGPTLLGTGSSMLFRIDGSDHSGGGADVHAIGVPTGTDRADVAASIPPDRAHVYTGAGGALPDVVSVEGALHRDFGSVGGLERIAARIGRAATRVRRPAFGEWATIVQEVPPPGPEIVVVEGDAVLGPGSGAGTLLVRGRLRTSGVFRWEGLVIVIGQGEWVWPEGSAGEVRGGVLVARTRAAPSPENPLGARLDLPGVAVVDFGGDGPGIVHDAEAIERARREFPFEPIAFREIAANRGH